MKKKAIIISCVVLVVLLLGGLTVVLLDDGNNGTVANGNNTENVENTENIVGTEDIVVDAGSEMDTIEGAVAEDEDAKVEVENTVSENKKPESAGTPNAGSSNSGSNNAGNSSNAGSSSNKNNSSSSNSGSSNNNVVADSTTATKEPVRVENKEYDSSELAALNAGYGNVVYVPENDFYVVLWHEGGVEGNSKAIAAIEAYLNSMGLTGTDFGGGVISSEANQYIVMCYDVREKTVSDAYQDAEDVIPEDVLSGFY